MPNEVFIARNKINSSIAYACLSSLFVFFIIKGFYSAEASIELRSGILLPLDEVPLPKHYIEMVDTYQNRPLDISMTRDGKIYVQNEATSSEELLRVIERWDNAQRIYLSADSDLSYGTVAGLLGQINALGKYDVALVVKNPTSEIDSYDWDDLETDSVDWGDLEIDTDSSINWADLGMDTNSEDELDFQSIFSKVKACWIIPHNLSTNQKIEVRVRLNPDGSLDSVPEIVGTLNKGPVSEMEKSVLRAVQRCAPFDKLPVDRYANWKEIIFSFDPKF